MLQQEHSSGRVLRTSYAERPESLNVLVYISTAVAEPREAEIQDLLSCAQSRNEAEGLTGVLLYENGTFFQWLEGPAEALARVWRSIVHDPRHCQIKVLRDEPIGDRVFEGWDLRIVRGRAGSVKAAMAALDSSSSEFRRLIGKPQSIVDLSLHDLFSAIVVPRLCEVHGRDARPQGRRARTATLWHAEPDSGAKLARELVSARSVGCRVYVDSMLDEGASLNALYHEVFEPAQLHLGELWDGDQCDDFALAMALSRLQVELRRVNVALPGEHQIKPNHSVLLCSQPHESHSLGLRMSSELFDRGGWSVDCQFPSDDETVSALVHAQWFDVLKLSQSGSLRRDSRLASMRVTIDSARSASLNPALIIMVDGRTFAERPQIYRAVHANAMSRTSLDAVSIAERLVAASRSVTAACQVSVA